MANNNALFIGWNRSNPGREKASIESFQDFLNYLGKQQSAGMIQSFTPVFLEVHGGDLNGFVLIQGEPEGLIKLQGDDAFETHLVKGTVTMNGLGVLPAYTGKQLENRMQKFAKYV